MTPIHITPARWSDVWPEAEPLMAAHRDEIDRDSARPFRVNVEMAIRMDLAGVLVIHQARQGTRLVGYLFWYLAPALDTNAIMASHGPWYVVPELRSWRVGARLWQASLATLRERGVRWALPHHYSDSPELGEFYQRLGARPLEITYLLDLERGKR